MRWTTLGVFWIAVAIVLGGCGADSSDNLSSPNSDPENGATTQNDSVQAEAEFSTDDADNAAEPPSTASDEPATDAAAANAPTTESATTESPTASDSSATDRTATTDASTTATPAIESPSAESPTTTSDGSPQADRTPVSGSPAPEWLGTRILPLVEGRPWGEAQPTPPELVNRQLWTKDLLPPPPDDTFAFTQQSPPPADVVVRSTWSAECPVTLNELSYLTVSFFGFDGLFHTGELLVNAGWADQLGEVFEALHQQRYPIEEMRVVRIDELGAPPTGDANNTTSFVCRPSVGSANSWSRHAFGLALDVNPFINPYQKADLVLPELSSAYLDRTNVRPGMIGPDQVALFERLGWGWGGEWNSALDYMHFSDNNR